MFTFTFSLEGVCVNPHSLILNLAHVFFHQLQSPQSGWPHSVCLRERPRSSATHWEGTVPLSTAGVWTESLMTPLKMTRLASLWSKESLALWSVISVIKSIRPLQDKRYLDVVRKSWWYWLWRFIALCMSWGSVSSITVFINCTFYNGTYISNWLPRGADENCETTATPTSSTGGKETFTNGHTSNKPSTNITTSSQTTTDAPWYIRKCKSTAVDTLQLNPPFHPLCPIKQPPVHLQMCVSFL